MNREQKKGIRYSGILHGVLLLIAIIGLPSFFFETDIEEPTAITVDILPIAAISNVKPSELKPAEKQTEEEKKEKSEEKKPEEQTKEKEKPSPKVDTSKQQPTPPEEKALPDPNKKAEKKPEKTEDKKPTEDPLDAILKSVKDTASKEKTDEKKAKPVASSASTSPTRSRSNKFDPNSPESMTIRDAIQSQVYKCWNIPAGAKDAESLIIPLEIDYDKTGMPLKVAIASAAQSRYNSDGFFRAAADSAIRAVRTCSPIQGLPPETYNIWQYVDMNFNPRDMLL